MLSSFLSPAPRKKGADRGTETRLAIYKKPIFNDLVLIVGRHLSPADQFAPDVGQDLGSDRPRLHRRAAHRRAGERQGIRRSRSLQRARGARSAGHRG